MTGEVEMGGVFFPIALVTGAAAFLVTILARRGLRLAGAYKWIWHAGLFDVAMFVVLWWGAVFLGSKLYGWVGL